MICRMERVTATLDSETVKRIRRLAGTRGVSRFLDLAARERLARLEILGLLDDLDSRHGRIDPTLSAEVDRDARRIFRR